MEQRQLTDDMKALLTAAYRVAPDGEKFYINELPLKGMSEQERADCAAALWRGDCPYLSEESQYVADSYGGEVRVADPRGPAYSITRFGRPIGKQLVSEAQQARRSFYWSLAKGAWGIAITVAVAVAIESINDLRKQQTAPTTQQNSP